MSDILSQDQIDALLNSQGFDSGGDGDIAQSDPASLYPALLKTFDIFCNQAGTVISTVLNKKVTFHTELCEKGSSDTIQEKMPSVLLSLKIMLKSAVEGPFYLIIQKTNVAVLSDLMMMGDGTAEYTEDHKDAIGELINQVMGAFTNALSTEWGSSVAADAITVDEFDIDHPPLPVDAHDMILVSQKIEQMSELFIALLIPRELSGQIADKTRLTTSSAGSAMNDSVGLNMSELDDLSKVTSFSSPDEGGFRETRIAAGGSSASQQSIDMLLDIDLDVSIELGKSMLSIKRILELAPGSIVELDRMAGEPVDLLVNNKVVAKGEVVVIDESFGIRIVSLVSPEERIRSLR